MINKLPLFFTVIVVVIISFGLYVWHASDVETRCITESKRTIPHSQMIPVSAEEKRLFPGMTEIDAQFRAKVLCEKKDKFLIIL